MIGTYMVTVRCANCTPEVPNDAGIVSGRPEYPSMSCVGAASPVDVIQPEVRKLRGVTRNKRLEYMFVCIHCGRKVWIQLNDPERNP